MSLWVVKDIGNYVGKFIESDITNFVGVWREYLRVWASILLEGPLKRSMKLRKIAARWCWVNFKYEGIPTFCFICGMVGHGEKFCAKLFDTPLDKFEKPYGSWMPADPRRRSHTIGSIWLRMGGATSVNSTVTDNGDESVTKIEANVIMNEEKSGITIKGDRQDKAVDAGEIQGVISDTNNC